MKYVPLPAICRLRQWPTIPQKEMSGHGYPVYGANGIIGYHSEYNHENPTLFIGCRGTCGSVHRSSPKSYINGNAMCLDDLKSSYSAKFVFYFLKGYDWKKVITGTGIPQITQQGLQKVLIPELSLEKQSEIANALEFIDEQSKHCTKQLNLLEEQVKSLFNEMFGDPRLNNLNWPKAKLGTLCEITRGGSPRPIAKYLGGNVPWIKIGDATDGDDFYITHTAEHIIPEGIKRSRYIKSGSLVFANCGVSLGFCRILKLNGCIHDGWLAFQNISPKIEKVFLLATINELTEYFRGIAPGGTQPNLNTKIMSEYEQILPPLELQKSYIERRLAIDKLRFNYQRQIDLLNELMEKKMEEYFGGEEDA